MENVPRGTLMRVAIHQPNYAPWCGYFAKLAAADVFVFLDDVQLPLGRSYVSRTRIVGPRGPSWLSVPIARQRGQQIRDVRFANSQWPRKHQSMLCANYARAAYFDEIWSLLSPIYASPGDSLGVFNRRLIETIASYLGIVRRTVWASEFLRGEHNLGRADERLIALVRAVGGDTYLSGSGGVSYQDPARFVAANVQLEIRGYRPIPYAQGKVACLGGLSILDALFHCGLAARELLVYSDHAGL